MPMSQNRTKWPIRGGAVSIQPGWFPGHSLANFYINMGYGNEPLNYSHSMVPVFSIMGPTNQQYDGTFCLPQVPLPANYTPSVGDNATIQIIELAQHGAALYNVCLDPSIFPETVPFTATFPIRTSHHNLPVSPPHPKSIATSIIILIPPSVRRHYLRRNRRPGNSRSEQHKLLQLDQSKPKNHLPKRVPLNIFTCAAERTIHLCGIGHAGSASRGELGELGGIDGSSWKVP